MILSTTSRIAAALLLLLCLDVGAADLSKQGDAHAMIQKYGCLSCHGMVRTQVGPGFAQIAARYRDDPTAGSRLPGRIIGGGVGTWGRLIMPRQRGMTEDEARLLAEWILLQPSPP